MLESKVFLFPSGAATKKANASNETTARLFADAQHGRGVVAYLSVDSLSQAGLLQIVARNAVTGIVDLRPKPIFDRPKFDHQKVVTYFYSRSIEYLEYALFQESLQEIGLERAARKEMNNRLSGLLAKGLTLFLYDQSSKERGWIERARQIVRSESNFRAEFHPHSLYGAI